MPDLPHQVRSTAGDYFMHGQDHRMRRAGMPGNICRVVIRLESGLNVELLRQRVAASPILDWLARVRLLRPLPLFAPLWCTVARPRAVFFEHDGQDTGGNGVEGLPQAVLGRDLHAGLGPALALDLVRRPDGTIHLLLSWNHTLMDARGAEMILRHLNARGAAEGMPTVEDLINPDQTGRRLSRWWRGYWHKVKFARGSLEWLKSSGREPLFSLLPALRPAGPCRNQCRVISFSEQETARIYAHSQRLNADFRRSHFYLAASLQAFHTVAARRGNKTGAYLVPVPHDMRRHGAKGPIFANQLSVLFYRIEPQLAVSLSETIGELTRQMMEQIRNRIPQSCMAALDLFKPMPLGYYVRHLGLPSRGKFASFCFSDSGETCAGMSELLGGRIQAVTHLVPTWRPPGLTVLFWSYSSRLYALLAWVDDCLSLDEVDCLELGLRFALLDEVTP